MDFAGLAALLTVPVSVFAAVTIPLRERGLVARLQRIEKLLAAGTVAEPQRTMLEHARDRLAERIAGGELQPRYVEFVWVGVTLCVSGLGVGFWVLLDHTFDVDPFRLAYQIGSLVLYFSGLVLLGVRVVMRTKWLADHRDTNYKTNDSAFL